MIFTETHLPGVFIVELARREDERGFFARTWCREEFRAHGLATDFPQANTSFSRHTGTLRGLHYQHPPHAEAKLVRCIAGAIFDVAVDIRPDSPTRGRWAGAVLSAENRRMLYLPEGFAHGFLTLQPDTEVTYQVSAPYAPNAESGYRYDDPAFAIDWPLPATVLSERDRLWQPFPAHPLAAPVAAASDAVR